MKTLLHYIKGHIKSEQQASYALETFHRYSSWDVELVEGVTPDTIDETEYDIIDLPNGRLSSIRQNEPTKYLIKKSCIFNNLRFYERVILENEPMAFVEHDAICCGEAPNVVNEDFVFLSYEYALKQSVFDGRSDLKQYTNISKLGSNKFPTDYPLRYYKDSIYKDAIMTPGTCAYIVTPAGARKLLDSARKNGLEQSDFHINSHNIELSYCYPSPVRYNINLNTSHKL